MQRLKRNTWIAFLYVLLCMLPLSVQAKTTVAKSSSLKNVTKARSVEGEWIKKGKQFRFRCTDGSYIKNSWFRADGGIYYADSAGNRVKGWVKYRNHLYYLNAKGILRTGWLKKGGKHYYLKKNGRRHGQGWLDIDGRKYYLDSDGARVSGTVYINEKGYYFAKNGVYDPSVKVKPEIDPKKPMVALTFDDGPGKYTDRLLDCLKKNNAKATFFMVGSSVPGYKATVKKMADMGCELGNHSYSHAYLTGLSGSGIASEVSRTSTNIKKAAGRGPTLFRLPYGAGASDSRVLSALGLPSIYWSIDTRDWANTGNPDHTVKEVLNNVKSGDIVLMHDIHYSSVVAAERIIPELKKRGYQLVTVSQLAKYKGKTTLKSGRTYRSF